MQQTPFIIDILVTIVDNYGDMGFAGELVMGLRYVYGTELEYIIWTDDVLSMREFLKKSQIHGIQVAHIGDFGNLRKSTLAISVLHAPIPNLDHFNTSALILRIDYLSLDPVWISNNEIEHIASTKDRQIIELIPSVLSGSAGLMPASCCTSLDLNILSQDRKHITIFIYPHTQECIDWESFPTDLTVYVFGALHTKKSHIITLEWLPILEFYSLLDTSEFVMIRGEVSWAHTIQTGVPFFWDMYHDIGGFPVYQSQQFLSLLDATGEYREIHQILNRQKTGKITYSDITRALYHTQFNIPRIQNLIQTLQKYIDRFHNSI